MTHTILTKRGYMKITAPFDRVNEIGPLIEAGTDELYCGVCSNYWKFKKR